MLRYLSRTIRVSMLCLAAAFAFPISAFAADTAYLIYSHTNVTQPIFSVSNALDQGSAGILSLQEDGQTYGLPVYRAQPGCQVTVQNTAAQLRVYPVEIVNGQGSVQWTSELSPSIGQMRVTLSEGVRSIACSEFANYASQIVGAYTHEVGAGCRLTNPGYYLVSHSDGGLAPSSVIVNVEAAGNATSASVPSSTVSSDLNASGMFGPPAATTTTTATTQTTTAAQTVSATQNRAPVLVNGKTVVFDAYTIYEGTYGYTYFKLRDLAAALNGTEKQYEVTWDKTAESVLLLTGQPYTLTGNELTPGATGTKTATLSHSPIYRDGVPVEMTAYLIGQNNYFKLRDIAQLFNFKADWDNDAMCIVIDTTKGYNT